MKKLNLFVVGGLLLAAALLVMFTLIPLTGDLGEDQAPTPEPVVTAPEQTPAPVEAVVVAPGPVAAEEPKPIPIDETPGYLETNVYFATDRKQSSSSPIEFSGKRGDGNLVYGQVSVSIPDSHEVGKIESPKWWKVWNRDDPSRYVLVLSVNTFDDSTGFANSIKTFLADADDSDVLLFIHGYNVGFDAAAKRAAQLSYDLKFTGAPMFYSWPSAGKLDGYPADETSVVWTVPHFKDFLRTILADLGAKNVHVIAHSMGNRALVNALSTFDVSTLPEGSAALQQIILAAPDIDVDIFGQLAAKFPGKAARITLYTSENDKAIRASKKFHNYPRVGGSTVIIDGIDTIDASQVKTDFLAHSYFGDSIIGDIFSILKNDQPPSERFGLTQESHPKGDYWRFSPGAER